MVSVIIRNKNEQMYIGFAIQSVIDYIPNAQIIVIDNNSSDDSLEIVKLFNNRCDISIITIDNYTPGKALNKAAELCKYDIVLILSAHAQITKLDMQLVIDNLNSYVAIFGNQTPIYYGKRINKRYIWSHFINSPTVNMISHIESRPFLHNAFCFYNKQDLLDMPFNEDLPGKEDRYWAIEAITQNKKYLYLPDIEVNHFYTINGATWKGIG